jgi:hypothetical protein
MYVSNCVRNQSSICTLLTPLSLGDFPRFTLLILVCEGPQSPHTLVRRLSQHRHLLPFFLLSPRFIRYNKQQQNLMEQALPEVIDLPRGDVR